MTKILLVEDDRSLAMLIQDNLEREGYAVLHAGDGAAALAHYETGQPDLLILDVMLPVHDGFTLARKIRLHDQSTPILFLTSKARPKDVVQGFEAGGNDYLKKPFGLEELLIRVRVLLSNGRLLHHRPAPDHHEFGQLTFVPNRRQLIPSHGDPIQLTLREADLLQFLCRQEGRVVPKEDILQAIWGDDSFLNSRSLDVFISRLRKYLQAEPLVEIVNQRGIGYMLVVHRA
ncbi:MAG: response regulator transcription factor [Lewinella sp.]|nr:response regulator transcription factor [Lewinella sp.]